MLRRVLRIVGACLLGCCGDDAGDSQPSAADASIADAAGAGHVDDMLYQTRKPSDLPQGAKWVYDHDFFLLLNLAVGGQWPGNPDATTSFPQTLSVDYVRVYDRS
ncbi:MAG TPA: hypothetical protein VJV78_23705 [Polyangiales bacterium]|nr:hypothetical protein [Polyangiales bacterium]